MTHGPKINLIEKRLDRFLSRGRLGHTLQNRHMIEHVIGRHPGINAKVLGQVPQLTTQSLWISQNIDLIKA